MRKSKFDRAAEDMNGKIESMLKHIRQKYKLTQLQALDILRRNTNWI